MTRVETTIGLFSLVLVIAITALVGLREGMFEGDEGRLAHAARGFEVRSVESGAQMFEQYCAECHAFNASGNMGPPLNEKSGLHGGDLGEGVAWRLEELNWDRSDPYGYVYSSIASGKLISTRPEQWNGKGEPGEMVMPAWSQQYGGPLRGDQMKDLANYVVNFRSYLPDASVEGAYGKACSQVLETIDVTRPQYTSKCYEKLCLDTFEERGQSPPEPPEVPQDKQDPAYVAALARYRADFFDRCEGLGGQAPPVMTTATATAEATVAVTGTVGAATGALLGTAPAGATSGTGTLGTTGTPGGTVALTSTPAGTAGAGSPTAATTATATRRP